MVTYMCINFISALKSLGGIEPDSLFLLKWLKFKNSKAFNTKKELDQKLVNQR